MKLKSKQNDPSFVITYDDLTNEINQQYQSFKKSTKKKAELSLLNRESNGGEGCNRTGGQGRCRNGRNGGRGG